MSVTKLRGKKPVRRKDQFNLREELNRTFETIGLAACPPAHIDNLLVAVLEFRRFPGEWPVRSADAPGIHSRFSSASSLRGIGLGAREPERRCEATQSRIRHVQTLYAQIRGATLRVRNDMLNSTNCRPSAFLCIQWSTAFARARLLLLLLGPGLSLAEQKPLVQPQQEFIDLRLGLFIHFNIPTFSTDDWPDPQMPAAAFNPTQLNCHQWAEAAKSAHMNYGCLTAKHHSGFCIWTQNPLTTMS